MSEVRLSAPVKATPEPILAKQQWREGQTFAPGAFCIIGEPPGGVWYVCPCGCGSIGHLPIREKGEDIHPTWEWDGDRGTPTLSPSINHIGHWHGFLRRGWWEQA